MNVIGDELQSTEVDDHRVSMHITIVKHSLVLLKEFYCCISKVLLPRCMECSRGIAMVFLSVRPSVCPSVKRMHCDKTEESYV